MGFMLSVWRKLDGDEWGPSWALHAGDYYPDADFYRLIVQNGVSETMGPPSPPPYDADDTRAYRPFHFAKARQAVLNLDTTPEMQGHYLRLLALMEFDPELYLVGQP